MVWRFCALRMCVFPGDNVTLVVDAALTDSCPQQVRIGRVSPGFIADGTLSRLCS